MHIGIDARLYGPKQGGLGRYIEQLILSLEKLSTNDTYVVFLRQENWNDYTPSTPRFTKILADVPWYGWREQLFLSPIIKKQRVDLMHFPHWNFPALYHGPFVVTIHDLLLLHHPTRRASTLGAVTYWLKNKAFRWLLNRAVRRAKHIIVPSDYTKTDLHMTLGVPLEKMTVTYQAPTPLPETPATPTKPAKPFVLYVGVAFPHKNLETLVRAWQLFKKTYHTDHELVIAGKENYFYQRLITSEDWKVAPDVRYLGFVPDSGLPTLYRQASLYVMPSLYEGYALPCLEALSFKLPVIASNKTCLPEVLQDAAFYFDPTSETNLAEAIYRGLTDETTRQKLIKAGLNLLPHYTTEKLAQQTNDCYQKNSG